MRAVTTMLSARARVAVAAAALLAVAGVGTLALAQPAHADGPTTFTSATPIAVPAAGSVDELGPADPYPSSIEVTGMTGTVSDISVDITGLTHSTINDLDVMLVSPTGASMLVMSDLGDPGSFVYSADADITIADGGAAFPPSGPLLSGTYAPINRDGSATDTYPNDTFPAPAPTAGAGTSLVSTFAGIDPNGTWSLYVVDDENFDVGTITGGWGLTITTTDVKAPTTIEATATPSTVLTTESVTLTARVFSGGEPVTGGTVRFSIPGAGHPTDVVDGVATFVVPGYNRERTDQWEVTYLGTDAYLTSTTTVTVHADNPTRVDGNLYCNPATYRTVIPTVGTAFAYPLRVFVEDYPGGVQEARVHIPALMHTSTGDLDIMVVSPEGDALMLMSDVPGSLEDPTALTFADGGAELSALTGDGGTYRPTNIASVHDTFPAPAPSAPTATTFADAFAGTDPNGAWSLYVVDNAPGDDGALAADVGGRSDDWCLELVSATSTQITLDAPSTLGAGDDVDVTATVTSGAGPVDAGTVTYTLDGGTPITAGTPDPAGQVTFTIPEIARGVHTIAASYTGTGSLSDAVAEPLTIAVWEGTFITIDAPASVLAGSPVAVIATVTGTSGTPAASGEVSYTVGGREPVVVGTPDVGGEVTFSVDGLALGTHVIELIFDGMDGWIDSSRAAQVEVVTPTTLELIAPPSAVHGESVNLSADVTADADGVTATGSVTFNVGDDVLGSAPLVDGTAALDTALPAGVQTVVATLVPGDGFAASNDDATIEVTPVASAGGPYAIAEGESLTLTATGSSEGATIGWDLDGDGDFSDATGTEVVLIWAELETFGIDDGPVTYDIAAQAEVDGLAASATSVLEVSNTGPGAIVDGPRTAVVGEPLTLKVSADDPSGADMADLFTYLVDWGDGSPMVEVVGPADPPVTHTYTEAGDYEATFAVVDRDGGQGGDLVITIEATPAAVDPTPTPAPTPPPSPTTTPSDDPTVAAPPSAPDLPSTGISSGWALALAAAVLVATGVVLALVRRRLNR